MERMGLLRQSLLDFPQRKAVEHARSLGYPEYKGQPTATFWADWREVRGALAKDSHSVVKEPEVPDPVDPKSIKPDDYRWAMIQDTPEGFRAFNDHCWPNEKMPRHIFRLFQAAFTYTCCPNHLQKPCDQPRGRWKRRVIINIGPGFGKSIYVARRWSMWRLACKSRDWRIAIVSETQRIAADWVNEIAEELTSNDLLLAAFGRFQSDKSNSWRPGHALLKVEGASRKVRWNVVGLGWGQQIQGMRLDELVIDDPETPENTITVEDRERGLRRIDYVLENRLEPSGGGVRLIATRIELKDIPGMLSARTWSNGKPMWEHVSFPALIHPDTGEASTAENAVSLWPERFPVETLREKIDGPPERRATFESAFQQNPHPVEAATFDMAWINGDPNDPNPRRGCLDRDRPAGDGADEGEIGYGHWAGERIRCFSLDPSGTAGWWAMVVADVNTHRDSADFKAVIIDIRRGKWTTAQFLTQVDEVCRSYKPKFFIPESNMRADLWNGDNRDFTKLKLEHGFQVVPHFTNQNKRDIEWGVKSLARDFFDGRIRIPYGDEIARRDVAKQLLTEIYEHRGEYKSVDDVLMACWFLKVGWRNLYVTEPEPKVVNGGWADVDWDSEVVGW